MGAIVPTITQLTSAIGAADSLVSTVRGFGDAPQQQTDNSEEFLRAQQRLALQQLKAKQAVDAQNTGEQAALSREKLQADAAAAESKRLAALRRAVSRQRAAYGANGIGNTDGSAEAVMLGMFQETDKDRTESERLDGIRNRVLEQDQAAKKRLDILQASQLRQKQQLDRAAAGIID